MKQLQYNGSYEWYRVYIRFLAALKTRLTVWCKKEKWKPTLPHIILEKLKEVKKLKNRFYHYNREEDRIQLCKMTREIRNEISEYRSHRWNTFLTSIQEKHEKSNNTFWKHLSRIYRPGAIPFKKLAAKNTQLTAEKDIVDELFDYYSKLFHPPTINYNNPHDVQIGNEYQEVMMELSKCDKAVRLTNSFEIKRIIQKLKPKKSSGIDNISNFIIKKLPPAYLDCLCTCFNDWLSKFQYIDEWKTAKIITLNKQIAGIPTCEQTRPISLLATHSKIYERILLERVKEWAEPNSIIPSEQSGFRKGCLLQTRILSMYQEIKNSLAGNVPTLGIYVDYKKAYDLVWHTGLIVKLYRMQIPTELLKIIHSWLINRKAYISFGNGNSEIFKTYVGLPQGSSLSPYIFIIYHSDILNNVKAFSSHLFADDLCTIITPPIQKDYQEMIKFINVAGSEVCQNLLEYAEKWKQPINISKTVVQTFHSQINRPIIEIKMNKNVLENVRVFKYLGFTWTDKISLKPTVDKCLEKIQKSYNKLKWLQRNKNISMQVLRTCFFAYSFPFFTWIFPFFLMLPSTQQEEFRRKYRVGFRIVHRCTYVAANEIFSVTKEKSLESYVCTYLKKRLE